MAFKEAYACVCLAAFFSFAVGVRDPCGELPDEPTMLSVIKPFSHAIYFCVDNVFLKYQIRSKLAVAVVTGMCEHYDKCFKNTPGRVTQEQRDASLDCAVERIVKDLPLDDLDDQRDPKEAAEATIRCLWGRLDVPLENKRKANAAFHWLLEIVRL